MLLSIFLLVAQFGECERLQLGDLLFQRLDLDVAEDRVAGLRRRDNNP
jgi:hypothetical protein